MTSAQETAAPPLPEPSRRRRAAQAASRGTNSTVRRTYPHAGWPRVDDAPGAAFENEAAGPNPRTALANRRSLMLQTLRSTDRSSLAQQIFDETAIAIVEGRLRPGETLNSVDLAQQFRTSRTPVREALVELQRQGAVVVAPRHRPQVARTDLVQLRDIYELRASLFTLVSELIIDNCPAGRLRELWKWQAALEYDAARGCVDDYFWHHAGFRLVESRLTDNEELQRIISSVGLRALQVTHLSFSLPDRLAQSVADHRRLLVAYEERDKVSAIAVNRLMIMTGYRALQASGLITDHWPANGSN